jgi:hypothetical protein
MDIPFTRDTYIMGEGDTYTATVSEDMVTRGWIGGQGVKFATSTKDELTVTFSDGLFCGITPYGSDEGSDLHTAMSKQNPFYRYVVVGAGSWIASTIGFEKFTYASRQIGPLVPITYQPSDRLLFSLNGLLTVQDEWSLSGDPRAPNGYFCGFVMVPPTSATNNHMLVQYSL